MNDQTKALLYLAAAGAIFIVASKLMASSRRLPKPSRLACLGDSLTAAGIYCGGLADILGVDDARAYGYEGQGTNVIGDHVDDVLAYRPEVVVVLAGVNDLPQGGGAQKAMNGLAEIYRKLRLGGALIVAVEIVPWHGYPSAVGHESNTDMVNQWIRREAFVDATVRTSSLGDYRGNLKAKYDSGDGLHLNHEGQRELARLIAAQAFRR